MFIIKCCSRSVFFKKLKIVALKRKYCSFLTKDDNIYLLNILKNNEMLLPFWPELHHYLAKKVLHSLPILIHSHSYTKDTGFTNPKGIVFKNLHFWNIVLLQFKICSYLNSCNLIWFAQMPQSIEHTFFVLTYFQMV